MKKSLLTGFTISLLYCPFTQASGLYLYEVGTEDVGLAGAGQAARAQDAATIVSNPAGMTRLKGNNLTMAGQALYGDVNYSLDNGGKSPGNVVGWFPGASTFYSHQVDDRLSVGAGLYGNYGLGLHFGDWAGSQLIKDSTLLALTFQPVVAYKINDHWSVGGGPGINYGLFSLNRSTDNGDQKTDDHDWALNGKLGILYELDKDTRFGLTYTSKTQYHFDVKTDVILNRLPGSPTYSLPLSAAVNTPQQLMLSAYYQLSAQWAVLGDLGWQDWSEYSTSETSVAGQSAQSQQRLQDTYHVAAGVQYQATDDLRLNTGVAFDSSFYKNQSDTSLTMPSGDAWRWGVGANYQLDPQSSLGTAFEYMKMESSTVQNAALGGTYDDPALYFFTINYNYRF
ncbi:OmpP1/FadL family transporter [Rahnella laticis]|uniref:OmpP1/FadL family transporter n=1 Tax=Rahnella laticis TaxID=2787622 RepID=UPI0018A27F76|nr:outer membrane protein transport protein [Rahnella laticis]MBF7993673.1 outer membrane protein transport protein [Rahnella laticis]